MTIAEGRDKDEITHRFSLIDTFVFDLDKTLYPSNSPLWQQIDRRITHYLSDMLGMDGLSAYELQKYYYHKYGTTLRGLQHEYQMDPEEFLAFVHDIDRSVLSPNPLLVSSIQALKGRKYVFTNGSYRHAEETLQRLDMGSIFDAIFSVEMTGKNAKPDPGAYRRFLNHFRIMPSKAAMFEDTPENLIVPHKLAMVTILVDDLGQALHKPEFVDFLTHNLSKFLERIR